MDDEIQQFKQHNGNVTYSVKELIGALHTKLDKIDEKLEGMVCKTDCTNSHGRMRNYVHMLFTILFTLIGGLATYVFGL